MNASANSIGGSNRIRPRHSVPISARKMRPVGIEMISVLIIIGSVERRLAPDQ